MNTQKRIRVRWLHLFGLLILPLLCACSSAAQTTRQIFEASLGGSQGFLDSAFAGQGGDMASLDEFLEQARILAKDTDVSVTYSPPYVPVIITRSVRTGKWGIGGGIRYHTAVGTFGLEMGYQDRQSLLDELRGLKAGPGDLILILEDRRAQERNLIHVKNGHDAQVVMDGRIIATFKSTQYGVAVLLDVTDAEVVQLYPRDTDTGSRPQFELKSPAPASPPDAPPPPDDPLSDGPAVARECTLPAIVEFNITPTGKQHEFDCTWRVEGASRVEMWGEPLPPSGSKIMVIKEASWQVLWAKVDGTPDRCYVEKSVFVEP